jgi:hypothetical protein
MKPGDFFLGVLDFFAILIPGSLATWLVTRYLSEPTLHNALVLPGDSATPHWLVPTAACAVSSYVLGHFVFMAGSKLDPSYDRWRKRVHPLDRDKTFKAADDLKKTVTPKLDGAELSTLKWARAYIQVKSAAARVEIDRLEAEQKFFRSLVVVAALFAAHFILHDRLLGAGVVAIAMSVLSYQRYLDRRWTMTELIFATAVIVAAAVPAGSVAPGERKSSETDAVDRD